MHDFVMLHTQRAYAESYAPSGLGPYEHAAPRVRLGAELRLATINEVIAAIDEILPSQPRRIELDASRVRVMTEGARRMLVAATARLEAREVDLVVINCEPFEAQIHCRKS